MDGDAVGQVDDCMDGGWIETDGRTGRYDKLI